MYTPKATANLVDFGLVGNQRPWFYMSICAAVIVLRILLTLVQNLIFARCTENILYGIRQWLYKILVALPMRFFDINGSGRIIARIVNDVTNLATFLSVNFFKTFSDILTVVGSLFAVLMISPVLAGWLSFIVIIIFSYLVTLSVRIGRMQRRFRSINSECNAFVADTMSGLDLLYAQNYSSLWLHRFGRLTKLFYLSDRNMILLWSRFPLVHTFIMGATYAVFFFLSSHELASGHITIGGFVAILSYIIMVTSPFGDLSQRINEFQTAMSSMSKILEILNLSDTIQNAESGIVDLAWPNGDIVFDKVDFSYADETPVFRNLNLIIPSGKTTAIIGRTGSGKTTVTNLIAKLYPIQSGSIRIGTTDLSLIKKDLLCKHLGIVTQQLFLFEESVRENLRLYDQTVTDEKLWSVLEEIGAADKVRSLPKQLDFQVEKNNDLFSQGERQLLVIARMLIRNPSILIFDEATASLDNQTEHVVQIALEKLFRNRTSIIIAHRPSTIRTAHRILVFDEGKLAEEGEREILEKNPKSLYARYLEILAHNPPASNKERTVNLGDGLE